MLCEGKSDIVDVLLKKDRPFHKYSNDLKEVLEMIQLSERFGFTPEQVRGMDGYDRLAYACYLRGESLVKPSKEKKGVGGMNGRFGR